MMTGVFRQRRRNLDADTHMYNIENTKCRLELCCQGTTRHAGRGGKEEGRPVADHSLVPSEGA